MKVKKLGIVTFISLVAIGLIIASVVFAYNTYLINRLWDNNMQTLEEIKYQQINNFDLKLQSDIEIIETNASLISKYHLNSGENHLKEVLYSLSLKSHFEYFCFADLAGDVTTYNGETANIADRTYFQKSISGETVISKPYESRLFDSGKLVTVISTPVYSSDIENNIVGVLFGIYKTEELNKLLLSSMQGDNFAAVITNEGDLVAVSDNNYYPKWIHNIADFYTDKHIIVTEGDSSEVVNENLRSNKSGYAVYSIDGQYKILLYDNINTNGWNIFSITSVKSLTSISNDIIKLSFILNSLIAILFIALFGFILYSQLRYSLKLEKLAYFDEFTNCPTMAKFKLDVQKYINEFKDTKKFILVKFDVDNFKSINQMSGREVGDNLIIAIAQSLKETTLGKCLSFARVRDDEFVVLHEYSQPEDIYTIRKNFLQSMYNKLGPDFNHSFQLISGYYYLSENHDFNLENAIEKANVAHRNSKKCNIPLTIYNETFIADAIKKKNIEDIMEKALEKEDFKVFLQPKYPCSGKLIVGAEALVRWKDSFSGTTIYPTEFIPLFETNGFIQKLDLYMFEKVCQLLSQWHQQDLELIPISINFSRINFSSKRFAHQLSQLAQKYNIDPKYLEIEITENALATSSHEIYNAISDLHQYGFRVSMDDFSSQHSSLSFLTDVNVDIVKLDRSFISGITNNSKNAILVEGTIKLLKNLGLEIVAEGVETKEQLKILTNTSCDIIQGYIFAKPMPADDVRKLLAKTL